MAKRRAGTELTDRNWDEEEQPEKAGTFQVAGEEELANRIIKRAKRRVKVEDGVDSIRESDNSVKPSPFAGLTFGTNKPTTCVSFMSTKSETLAQPSFSFKSSMSDQSPALTVADTVLTCTLSSSSSSIPTFGKAHLSTSSLATNGTSKTTSSGAYQSYIQKLQNLNHSVAAWIQKHVSENPVCDLTPVFEDYKKHLRQIEKLRIEENCGSTESGAQQTGTNPQLPKTVSSTVPLSFGKTSNVKSDSSSATSATTFSFERSSESKDLGQAKADFSFKDTAANMAASSTYGFSFSRSDTIPVTTAVGVCEEKPPGSGSLFSASKSFSHVSGTAETSKAGDVEEYEPPKPEIKVIEEKDSLLSKRCKIFYKKDDTFKDRGVGTLHLKKVCETVQLLVRADNNLGSVILNILLPESLPVTRQGKNNLLLMTPINPPVERTCPKCKKKYPRPQENSVCDTGCIPEATALLIRVKTAAEADELFEKINKLRVV